MKTYVEFNLTGRSILREVKGRDLRRLTFPKGAFRFYFLEAPEEVPVASVHFNVVRGSAVHIIADDIAGRDELRDLYFSSRGFHQMMRETKYLADVFMMRTGRAEFHALTDDGGFIPLREDMKKHTVVVGHDRRKLWPKQPY